MKCFQCALKRNACTEKCFGPSPAQGHFLKEMLLWRYDFIILDDRGNGKVQKVSPKGIHKEKLPWATKVIIFYHFYC